MRLSKLVTMAKIEENPWNTEWEREISALSIDSREKAKNSLFFCLKGEQFDGHDYALNAVKNGAVAIVAERAIPVKVPVIKVADTRRALGEMSAVFYGEPAKRMQIIGVTGTNGKTTTSYMLASILEKAEKKVGVIGTLGIRYGGKEFPSELTTPDPIALQRSLAEMALNQVEYVIMEVSAHALHYQKAAGIDFAACIFTNLSQDHLDFFKTMSAYKEAKRKLFDTNVSQIAILNGDDKVGREFGQTRENGGKTVYYGMNTPTDAFAIITDETLKGSECMLNINDKLCRISVAMTGKHNVYNALAAATCATELGISAFAISEGIGALKRVEGRLERVCECRGAHVYVDFAHTPDGLEKSLEALKSYCKGRLICLFGCGGNRDKTKRPIMGEMVAKRADFAVLTSDNPRYEDPLDIICGIEKGYRRFSSRYVVVPDRKKAIEYALETLKKDDVLLIAGKGGETYQEIMGIKYPFNDHDMVMELLGKNGENRL